MAENHIAHKRHTETYLFQNYKIVELTVNDSKTFYNDCFPFLV